MKFRQIFPNWKNCEHVLGGIGAKNIYLRHFRLLDLGILNFSIIPAYAEATAWQAGPDVKGQINERFPRFRKLRQSNQFGHGMHFHLLHHVSPMDLYRLLDGTENAGNLFV
jgi:hypothetical protein